MKINWARFLLFFCFFQVCFLLVGCTAAWLSAISALLPALEAAVSAVASFVLALEGKTVSTGFSNLVQTIVNGVKSEIAEAQQLIAAYKAAASQGTLAQLQALFQAIVTNLNGILSGLDVTDASTVAKITQLVGLAVAAASAVIALIPSLIHFMQMRPDLKQLEGEDKVVAKMLTTQTQTLEETYETIIGEHTVNADVNAALDALPRTLIPEAESGG
jgi:hypothetical protein